MAHHILSGPRGQLGGVPHDAAGGSLSQPRGDEAVLFEAEVAMSPFPLRERLCWTALQGFRLTSGLFWT